MEKDKNMEERVKELLSVMEESLFHAIQMLDEGKKDNAMWMLSDFIESYDSVHTSLASIYSDSDFLNLDILKKDLSESLIDIMNIFDGPEREKAKDFLQNVVLNKYNAWRSEAENILSGSRIH